MSDTPKLRPATRDELAQSVSFALRFNGRKREPGADEIMANITAERLIEHLERPGYVVGRATSSTVRPRPLRSTLRFSCVARCQSAATGVARSGALQSFRASALLLPCAASPARISRLLRRR
jgi:hypothetical protein